MDTLGVELYEKYPCDYTYWKTTLTKLGIEGWILTFLYFDYLDTVGSIDSVDCWVKIWRVSNILTLFED